MMMLDLYTSMCHLNIIFFIKRICSNHRGRKKSKLMSFYWYPRHHERTFNQTQACKIKRQTANTFVSVGCVCGFFLFFSYISPSCYFCLDRCPSTPGSSWECQRLFPPCNKFVLSISFQHICLNLLTLCTVYIL